MSVSARHMSRQAGLTLVELMVSILIGIILVAGAVSMLVTSKSTYVIQEDLARIQESGRLAMEIIQNDLRMAGYGGCANDFATANGAGGVPFGAPIEGFDNPAGGATWHPSATAVANLNGGGVGDPISTSDGITIRHIGGPTTALTAGMVLPTDPIPANNSIGLQTGDLIAVSDCSGTEITAAVGVGGTITTGGLGRVFPVGAQVSAATNVRYYVGTDANGAPALFRILNGGAPQLLIDGVEMMQITYGEDTDADGLPNRYQPASAGLNWDDVSAVRIGLLMRSTDQVANDTDTFTYDVDIDGVVDFNGPGDRRRRRVMTTTVFVRNDST